MDLPLTRSVAARLDVRPQTASTNADLRHVAADAAGWPHLSVIATADQTAGRGRLDRSWIAPAGASLAVSVLLRRLPASAEARGWIPLAAGVAMADAVAAQLPEHDVAVKWPNDVLVGGAKICGILAEAAGDAVIVGSGVNTAMTTEQLPVSTATSFAVLGVDVDADRLLSDYLRSLDAHLRALAAAGAEASGLHAAVAARCATIGSRVRVSLPGDGVLEGRATGLDPDGRLLIESRGAVRAVAAGDVVHVRPASSGLESG